MNSSTTCLVPWRSVYLSPDGRVSPCCAFNDGDYNEKPTENLVDHPKLQEVRSQFLEGKIPQGCSDCFMREAKGLSSMRTEMQETYRRMGIGDESGDQRIRHLDISFGNACNLKCRFCRPENSSALILEHQQLNEKNPSEWSRLQRLRVHDNGHLLDQLFKHDLSGLRYIEIKGGEPFIYKRHAELLKNLDKACDLKNVRLHYSTNGTSFQADVTPHWEKFNSVNLTFSIDGTGSVYRYIRGGKISLEKEIIENIRLFDKHTKSNTLMTFYCTVCAYNIFEIRRLNDFVESLNLKSRTRMQFILLTDPHALRVSVLPLSLRQKAAADLPVGEDFDHLRRAFLEDNADQEFWYPQFMKYTMDVDVLRMTDLREDIPDLSPCFKDYIFLTPEWVQA